MRARTSVNRGDRSRENFQGTFGRKMDGRASERASERGNVISPRAALTAVGLRTSVASCGGRFVSRRLLLPYK